ncbi:hypothetical protein PWEIH_12215 [Listeria weihenstephanensis FSL R9-0317]|uniref:Uncharacterized protein n=1 Tax=Listeria weihenstephanensis TaxID=1006155 RepID=A0A1S7FUY1_9LIST|nr:hypothetical protein [Listeria weihenstephanensis]AQY51155.1 hypothetical protein UE46_08905 [Listeria weihenstephanensis]EUJ36916.1 hypothetical protein PWEIH_12215 [Listeria weihenstephanensis FSL R9-0317]
MKISKSEHVKFSQLFSNIEAYANDEKNLNQTLNALSLENLEHLKAYLSGTIYLTPYHHIKSIIMCSFVGTPIIYFLFLHQANIFFSFIALLILLFIEIKLFHIAYKPPVHTHVILAHRRRKYDRIVQVIETILKKRYLKELQNAIIGF